MKIFKKKVECKEEKRKDSLSAQRIFHENWNDDSDSPFEVFYGYVLILGVALLVAFLLFGLLFLLAFPSYFIDFINFISNLYGF